MMTSSPKIEDYIETKNETANVITKADVYKVHFKLINSNNAMSNAIRRILLGGLPNIAFDDTYDNKDDSNMIIEKNVSALHNEFIAHRLSLLPICGYKDKDNRLKISIDYDFEKARFKYAFKNADTVPIFRLKMKNDETTRKEFGNIINVESNMIKIETESGLEPSTDFLLPDYITGDYCLLHRLKPLSTNDEIHEAEELDIYHMRPTIGTARQHARYCPVGTVSYEFEKNDIEHQNSYFSKYIQNLQNQRRSDNLDEYNQQDIQLFRASFDNLGSERIYKKQADGDAVSVIFNVESVGNQQAHQLVYDTLEFIRVKTLAILNHFEWNSQSGSYRYSDKKITIARNAASGNTEITIHYEDHTVGNLISTYLKKLFITNKKSGEMLSFASYKLPHPLEEKIVIIVGFKDGVDLNGLFKEYDLKPTIKHDDQAVQLLFIACSHYLKDVEQIKRDWSAKSGITEASYELNPENLLLISSKHDRSNKI